MNKKIQFMMLLISALGFLILSLSSIFRYSLTDFALGFCEGISVVFIAAWGVYMVFCFVRKHDPYKIG